MYKLPIFWGLGVVIVRKPTPPPPKKSATETGKTGIKKEQKQTQKGIIAFVWVHSIFVTLIRRDYVNYATYLLLIWSLLQVSPLYYVITKDKFSILQKWLQDGEQYAKENGLVFLETSAKTAQNVNELFYEIGNSSYLICWFFLDQKQWYVSSFHRKTAPSIWGLIKPSEFWHAHNWSERRKIK